MVSLINRTSWQRSGSRNADAYVDGVTHSPLVNPFMSESFYQGGEPLTMGCGRARDKQPEDRHLVRPLRVRREATTAALAAANSSPALVLLPRHLTGMCVSAVRWSSRPTRRSAFHLARGRRTGGRQPRSDEVAEPHGSWSTWGRSPPGDSTAVNCNFRFDAPAQGECLGFGQACLPE
jgi:hypothetical protein